MKRETALADRILRDAEAMGLELPHGAAERLADYSVLLEEKALPLGLVARSDAARIYQRHVLDSLRAAALVRPEDSLGYDLGSGAGLPGVVLAVAAPWFRVVLVEPRRRRMGFLEMALERLGLQNAGIAGVRAETLAQGLEDPGDLVSARAFASLERTWLAAAPLLRPGGRLVYFAGESMTDPIAAGEAAAGRGLPAAVGTTRVLATSRPLVIMTRK